MRRFARCRPGQTLEIGGGSGNLMNFMPAVISTDVVPAPWLDAQADAQRLPFAPASFDNIAMFDVLHHLERPRLFFQEAERVLVDKIRRMEPTGSTVERRFRPFGLESSV
jgi:SAM-dependent methyltransferase